MSIVRLYKADKIVIPIFPETISQVTKNNTKFQSYSLWQRDVTRSSFPGAKTLVQYDDFRRFRIPASSNLEKKNGHDKLGQLETWKVNGNIQTTPINMRKKKFWEELIAYFPWYGTDYIENDVSNTSSIVTRVFVTAVTFLPSRCLATIGGYTYRHTDWWEGFLIRPLRWAQEP
jgi:hypothetical protein